MPLGGFDLAVSSFWLIKINCPLVAQTLFRAFGVLMLKILERRVELGVTIQNQLLLTVMHLTKFTRRDFNSITENRSMPRLDHSLPNIAARLYETGSAYP